jgi:ParB family transcriptional regulator, chromosome partitioning protein
MFLLKAQKYLQEMEGDKVARKPALGRGLDALIPGGDFSFEKDNEAVEVDVDVRSDIDIDVVTDIGTADAGTGAEPPAEQPGTLVPAEASGDVSIPDASDGVPSLAADDVTVDDLPLDDVTSDGVPSLAADDVTVDDLPLDDVAADGAAEPAEPVEAVEAASSLRQDQGADEDLPDKGAVLGNDFVVQLAVDRLVPNPGQPRKNFDETELQELADSIKEHGVIMPIIAADTGGEHYTIIAGERRARAARLAGLTEVPVIIRNYTDQKRMEISLIENIQRSDLNPIEEATAYKNLMDFSSLSHEELAARVGKNRSTVTNALRLLKLSAEVQKSLETGDISSGHARALLSVTDDKLREKLFREITAKGLSVREAEKKASALNAAGDAGGDEAKEQAPKRPPEITDMEEKFIERLGTKVSISGGLEKGLIRIEYYSMEDLDRLYGIISGN